MNFNEDKPRRVAIYIRVSTSEQKIDGYGLEAQRKKLLDYVHNNKSQNFVTKPEWFFTDVHTGSELNREGLQAVLKLVQEKKIDAVLVWKIDRLSRSLKHLLTIFEDFEKHEVSFVSVQENIDFRGPIGKLIFQIFGAIAQFERELIKGRTQMGRLASAEAGNYTGTTIPYGYAPVKNPGGKGKKLALIAEEKRWIEEIFKWYVYNDIGFGEIAKKLISLKVPYSQYSRSNRWTHKVISTIIHNPIYRGEFVANKRDENGKILPQDQWTIVDIPPCISEFIFQQAQSTALERNTSKSKDYLLSGKVIDVSNDFPRKFIGAKRTKGGYSYRRKHFIDKRGDSHAQFEMPAKQLEEFTWGKVVEALKNPSIFIQKYIMKQYADRTHIERLENHLSNLRQQKVNRELEIARVEEGYDKGVYSEDRTKEKISEKNSEIAEIENKIQEIEDEISIAGSVELEVKKLKEAATQIRFKLENLNQEQKKVLINLFIDRIEVNRFRQGKKWKVYSVVHFRFNPNRFANTLTKVCTDEGLEEGKKYNFPDDDSLNGGRGHGGCKIFRVWAMQCKRPVRIETMSGAVGSMEVYWEELNSEQIKECEEAQGISAKYWYEL